MIEDISLLDLNKKYTYADYLTWRFKERVELIRGKVFKMSPAPSRKHQEIIGELFNQLYSTLKKNPWQVFIAPFDVRLPLKKGNKAESVVHPDICIVCDESKLDDKGCNGAPDLIIEILSPNTSRKDTQDKFVLYEENQVKEYWLVYPGEGLLDVYKLNEKEKYYLDKKYTRTDPVPVGIFNDLTIDLTEVFEEDEWQDPPGTVRI